MTRDKLLLYLRDRLDLSKICITRLDRYVLKGCHDLQAFTKYTEADVLRIYAQNLKGKNKPFAGKDFFKVVHEAQKIIIDFDRKEAEKIAQQQAEEKKIADEREQRNPHIKLRVLRNAVALCDLAGKSDDDVINWDMLMLTAAAFGIELTVRSRRLSPRRVERCLLVSLFFAKINSRLGAPLRVHLA